MTIHTRRYWQSSSTTGECDGASGSSTLTPGPNLGSVTRGRQASRTSLWLALLLLVGSSAWCRAASLTLSWDALDTTNVLGYRIYQSVGTALFTVATNAAPTARSITVAWVDMNMVNRFYVTTQQRMPPYAALESDPSNIVTNSPAAAAPNITLFAPTLGSTSVMQGNSLNIAAVCRNYGNGDFQLASGSITLLAPGATRTDGPYVYALVIPAQVIAAGATATFSTAWLAPTNAAIGQWTAYLAVQGSSGVWSGGPGTLFNVVTMTPLPPLAPTNLRAVSVTARRYDLQWDSDLSASTEIEQSIKAQPFATIATVPPATEHYSTQLSKQREYTFRARSVNGAGPSPYSNLATVTPP